MLKKLSVIAIAVTALLSMSFAQAENFESRSTFEAQVNSQIIANGTGAITGPILNTILVDLANSIVFGATDLGSGVLTALSYAANVANGIVSQVGSIATGDCLKWGPGVADAGLTCAGGNGGIRNASGSAQNTTGTISATSTNLVLTSQIDFVNGEGIRVNHAGTAFSLTAPSSPSVTVHGTAGSTTYHYELSCLDAAGGVGSATASFDTTTGNATLGITNYNVISWTNSGSCAGIAIYRLISSTYTLIGVAANGTTFSDFGYTAYPYIDWIPTTASSSALSDALVTTISSGGGTTNLTLGTAATRTATNQGVYHDDSAAVQAAVTANVYTGYPAGTFYQALNVSIPAGHFVSGLFGATTVQSVFPGEVLFTFANGALDVGLSNLGLNLLPNATGLNSTFIENAWISNLQCVGASIGYNGTPLCLYLNYNWAITIDNIFLNGWLGTIGAGAGGATPSIYVDDSTHSSTQLYFSRIIAKDDGEQPLPAPIMTISDCFNCNLYNSILGATTFGTGSVAGSTGIELIGGNQAINISGLQTLGFNYNMRLDSDATGSLLTLNLTNSHFDFCAVHCIDIEEGAWITIMGGNSFAGESSDFSNNVGIYGGSGFTTGPNIIAGNTFEGFAAGSAAAMDFLGTLNNTSIYGNNAVNVATFLTATAGTLSAIGPNCSGSPSSSFSAVNGVVGHC
jgi:hypothetical protein